MQRSQTKDLPPDFFAPVRDGVAEGRKWLDHVEVGGTPLELAILSLGGLLLMFWGKILFRAWLVIAGLLSGWNLGTSLNARWLGLTDNPRLIFLAILALAFALLFSVAYRFSFFLAGAAGGVYLIQFLSQVIGFEPESYILIIAAVIGGALAASFRDFFAIIATSITGAFMFTDGFLALIKLTPAGSIIRANVRIFTTGTNILVLILIVILTILGTWIQVRRGKFDVELGVKDVLKNSKQDKETVSRKILGHRFSCINLADV